MLPTADQLQLKFQVSGLSFATTSSGLIKLIIQTSNSSGEIYLHGAHVTSFVPNGDKDLLWMSNRSQFSDSQPIRGGIPICFPWFGPNAEDPSLPGHGYARLRSWELISAEESENGIKLGLQTQIGDFELLYEVDFGSCLELKLTTRLSKGVSDSTSFEAALHTYLAIGDIHDVTIEGLETAEFIDKVDGATRKPAAGQAITFDGECDRVYVDTDTDCRLVDAAWNRTIEVSKQGSQSSVVWNPWIAKSAAMADFGDDEWPGMVCIETANAGPNAITIHTGESHTMMARIRVK